MFQLKSKYSPTGDQPQAIKTLCNYLKKGHKFQTLWGVTGSGKTFTMANIIQNVQKPTLIIAHNKTLAAQLALEFKEFFPDNAVHYFVSYYDYYQPEAYVGKTDTYIEKEATINAEIDRLRHAATQDLISRKDVIIVASVSCIYGVGDIKAYEDSVFEISVGEEYHFDDLIKKLLLLQFKRAGSDFKPGTFQVMGDLLEIFPSSQETVYSLEFWGNEITQITRRNYLTGEIYEVLQTIEIFPAKHTVTTKDTINRIIPQIQEELKERLDVFKAIGDELKHERLKTKVEYDIEMMQEVGYVNGIENYSRYLDGRKPGEPPATLIDYFGDDFLCLVDESHMTISQIGGMYAGDRARKENLVNAGFRLPSAMDNRPMRFVEFEKKIPQMVLVSATPGEYDIIRSCQDEKTHLTPNSINTTLTPNPSPKGRGELLNSQEIIYDLKEYYPEYITNLAKKLRKNLTTSEELLWELLRNRKFNNLKFRRQHPIGRYIADFYCDELKLVIELDGKIHDFQKEYDEIRDEFLKSGEYQVLRFKNEDILENIEKVFSQIIPYIPLPLGEVRGGQEGDGMPSPLAPLPSGEGETEEFIFSDNNEVSFKNYTTSDKAYQKAQEFFEFDPTQGGVWSASEDMRIVPQVIRPTGLLDPIIELRSMRYMVDDVMKNLKEVLDNGEKMLITTLTKRSSEELTDYLLENGIKVKYLHSEIETLERLETLKDLRTGKIDVIVGVNLLREGLDLPEVTKICILDADKQGFLRSSSALIQIIGRAARNEKGRVYMYSETIENEKKLSEILANNQKDFMLDEFGQKIDLYALDKGKMVTKEGHFISSAMKVAINLTNYRRKIQKLYNEQHGITPKTVISDIKDIGIESKKKDYSLVSEKDLEKEVKRLQFEMDVAAANMEYEKAAELRDELIELRRGLKKQ